MAWLSLIPPLITIVLTFKTKRLVPALFLGVVAGSLISSKSILGGIISIGSYLVDAVADKDSAYTLGFLIAFSALADVIEMAGGIAGFSEKISKWVKNERHVSLWTWLLSVFTFFDSSFHTIAVGTMLSPIMNKVKGSKEKFAFLLSVTSLQLILLIPIATAYLGYMVALVTNNIKGRGIEQSAYTIVAQSVLWNFFSWVMILIAIGVSIFGLGFGRIRLGKISEGEGLTQAHIDRDEASGKPIQEYPKKSMNLLVPVIFLLICTIFFFWWTGRKKSTNFFGALSEANFNASIFAGIILTLIITSIFFMLQKISLAEIEAHIIIGAEKVLSLVLILSLSWALTIVTEKLGFNDLISDEIIKSIPAILIPPAIFLFAAVISYTIGSSWATWALVMPTAVTFAVSSGVNISIMIGTVWAGGAVADVISPLSAQMAGISFGEHLSTSFPYVIGGVLISAAGYLLVGVLF
ncbi:MAG TPA: Na+/H+ antiporter NhaC family protein [Clostridia bacterium]|nr:Na+/H+ antiporter NhaC family protein [Clostridia bacterium]